jgi:heme/copper-type cytochrome/quinol oxidase subunit 3
MTGPVGIPLERTILPGARRKAQPAGYPEQGWGKASTATLGMLLFLSSEALFFAGLISAFLVFRVHQMAWPPMGQPRLPVGATAIHTVVLLASLWPLLSARRAARDNFQAGLFSGLTWTAVLGLAFLTLQGREWLALLAFGLKPASSVFGGLFYTLVGIHALHVMAACVALMVVLGRSFRGNYAGGRDLGIKLFSMYWMFVVGIWPLLYVLVYLL